MLAFRVPRELHERLKRSADQQGVGIAPTSRDRLETSFEQDPADVDPKTREVRSAVNFALTRYSAGMGDDAKVARSAAGFCSRASCCAGNIGAISA